MSVLVIAEHDNSQLKAATLNTVTAAMTIGGDITLLVAGSGCSGVAAEAAVVTGIDKVLLADDEAYGNRLAENIAPLIAELASAYSHVLAPATTTGKNILPRAAALLDVQPLSDVIAIESDDTFKRPIYAGNVIATVKSTDVIKVMTVRTTAFNAAESKNGKARIDSLNSVHDLGISSFVNEKLSLSERPDLTSARVVISGGRGMAGSESFKMLEALANKLDAAIGASRAAVDAGYVANDMQVGQTGKIVAPDLYIAVGISGAIQHLAGMKDSKIVVAINKDEEAPIFQVADYGLVADLFDVLPELEQKL
jgi:electron transfer flavoprotein alpha subunit